MSDGNRATVELRNGQMRVDAEQTSFIEIRDQSRQKLGVLPPANPVIIASGL